MSNQTHIKNYNITVSRSGTFHMEVTRLDKTDLDNTLNRLKRAFPKSDGFEIQVWGIPYKTRQLIEM